MDREYPAMMRIKQMKQMKRQLGDQRPLQARGWMRGVAGVWLPGLLAALAAALVVTPALSQTGASSRATSNISAASTTTAGSTSAAGSASAAGAVNQPGGNRLPEALKDLPRAGTSCRNEPLAPVAQPAGPVVRADLSCAVSVPELRNRIKQAGQNAQTAFTLADLRPQAGYQAYHLDGALNLTPLDLHGKPHWRDKPLVLIGSGKGERELYSECTRLKQSGYRQVQVLRGGMAAWLAQQGAVQGRVAAQGELARLSASEFWLESQNPDNVLLLGKEQSALKRELPLAFVLAQSSAESLKSALARRQKELKNAPLAAVILAAAPGISDVQIARLQQAVAPAPLLVYADSSEALARQLATQKAMWLAQARGPKQPACGR